MTEEKNFLDELLELAEQKEIMQTESYYDLLLSEIKKMQNQIEYNFCEAEKEVEIINKFVLKKNSILDEKIKFVEMKLECFIKERNVKSISLANGTLKMHKKQDRIEISDLDLFLKHATKEMLSIIPEQIKPDLTKIKSFVKMRSIPKGVKVIEGEIEFSYKLRKDDENGGTQEVGNNGIESTGDSAITFRQSA